MGWHDEGLYLAARGVRRLSSKPSRQRPPAGGRATTSRLWFSTRPVSADQQMYTARSASQFFFVPEVNGTDGRLGTVGQWHRPGDAMARPTSIPHPKIQQSTRLLPGRYVDRNVHSRLGPERLGPDGNHPEMAFNHPYPQLPCLSSDYFWSAPKELATQNAPQTRGAPWCSAARRWRWVVERVSLKSSHR